MGSPSVRSAFLLFSILAVVPGEVAATSFDVLDTAKHSGLWGTRVSLEGCPVAETELTVSGTVSDDRSACETILATADVSGTVELRAGKRIVLDDGFSVASGSSFAAVIDTALLGDAYLQDDNPEAETVYAVRYYVDATDMNLPASEQFEQFQAFDAAGRQQFRIVFKHNDITDENRIYVAARDGSGFSSTEDGHELALPDGYQAVEVNWMAGSPGSLEVCVGADANRTVGTCEALGFTNGTGQVDFVRWGAIGVDDNTTGSFDIDDFDSRRIGNIGLLP